MSAHEVVLPEEVPRLRRAAVVLVIIDVVLFGGSLLLTSVSLRERSLDALGAPFILVLSLCTAAATVAALAGSVGVLARPSSAAWRRIAFVGSLPIASLLLVSLLFLTFLADEAQAGDFVAYVMLVLVTAGTVWSVSVFWPTVQLDSGTSSGNRPHLLSGSTSSTSSS